MLELYLDLKVSFTIITLFYFDKFGLLGIFQLDRDESWLLILSLQLTNKNVIHKLNCPYFYLLIYQAVSLILSVTTISIIFNFIGISMILIKNQKFWFHKIKNKKMRDCLKNKYLWVLSIQIEILLLLINYYIQEQELWVNK